jgi:phenylpropionate dioxygenase-like ring-hydroxylating dioxygenase large terminal subunit
MGRLDTNVLLPRDVGSELLEHARNKTTCQAESQLSVPVAHFTSPERAEAEIGLLRRLPLVVAHVAELPQVGDFVTRKVLGAPLIITRLADGGVAIYRNICRHRGGVVESTPSGNKRSFMCQYHGWSYKGEDGSLMPVFYEPTFGKIDYACRGLFNVRAQVRHGFVFATLDPDSPLGDIDEYLGAAGEQMAPWRLDGAVIVLEHSFTRAINWKLVLDGAIDPLHPLFLHNKPGGVGDRTLNNTAAFRPYGRHGKMFGARDKLKALADSGATEGVSTKHVGSVMILYPNSIFVESPDHVEFWTIWPTIGKPGECTIDIKFLARPEILTPEMTVRIHKSWDILAQAALDEDFPMECAIQENAETVPGNYFIYGRNEAPAQHLHRQLAKDLGS